MEACQFGSRLMIGSFKNLLESENQPGAAGPLRCGWKGIECGDYWVNFLHYPRVTHIFGPSAFGDVERSDGYEIAWVRKKIFNIYFTNFNFNVIEITLLIYIINKYFMITCNFDKKKLVFLLVLLYWKLWK